MAGFSNNMTNLVQKLENRLGTRPLNLPDQLKKEVWGDKVIIPDTLTTFSRYFPHQFKYIVNPDHPKKNGYYFIDEDYLDGVEILGIRDLDFATLGNDSLALQQNSGFGIYDFLTQNYGVDDIGLLQMRADHMSLFNNGIYVDFIPPNQFRLESATGGDMGGAMKQFTIILLVKHNANLTTISPTQMETFESLAQADIANFLYKELKYYDGLNTVYANIDLKLSDLEQEAQKRDEVMTYIKDNYVTAANKNQPYILTV